MSQNKVYVGNLAYSVTEDDLHEFFGQYGQIAGAKLVMDRETNRSKGFAFITFDNAAGAQAALASNGMDLQGRPLKVNMAKEDDRNGGGRMGGGAGRSGGGGRW